MKKPNFFIVGAPRCGTTSLVTWLSEHPRVFIPCQELHFWSTDLKYQRPRSKKEYENIFQKANDKHIAIGEKSPSYFFSRVAIEQIERAYPGARYIVMIRNPIEMAYSLWRQRVIIGTENVRDFLTAWQLSPERRAGKKVPITCLEPKTLDYQNICLIGEHLERLLQTASPERVLVLLLEDVKQEPRREYLKVLEFLGVPDDGRTEFPAKNKGAQFRVSLPAPIRKVGYTLVRRFKFHKLPMTELITKTIFVHNVEPLSTDVKHILQDFYRNDILKLSQLIDRNLSHWLE